MSVAKAMSADGVELESPQGYARKIWYPCRELLLKSYQLNRLIFNVLTNRARRRALRQLRIGHWNGLPLLRPFELRQRIVSTTDTCHIVGSGWSVNTSKRCIKSDDFVLGFNFAALAGLRFNLYLCELHTRNDTRRTAVSDMLERLIRTHLGDGIDSLYFHSLWLGGLNGNDVVATYGTEARCLSDYQLSSRYIDISEHMRAIVVERLLRPDPDVSAVVATTSITAIALAYRLGFRRIVIHGLDGGGPHFFSAPDFEMPVGFEAVREFYPKATANESYYPGSQGLRLLPTLRDALHRRGVTLLAGCAESPSSDHLSVY